MILLLNRQPEGPSRLQPAYQDPRSQLSSSLTPYRSDLTCQAPLAQQAHATWHLELGQPCPLLAADIQVRNRAYPTSKLHDTGIKGYPEIVHEVSQRWKPVLLQKGLQ